MSRKNSKENKTIKFRTTEKKRRVKFSFIENGAEEVSLVGDFNSWNPEVHPMKKDKYGIWEKDLVIPPGRYEYKFLVDGNWAVDPKNKQIDSNCYGTYNSVLNLVSK